MTDQVQRFTVNLMKDAEFKSDGLRSYFVDRELGIAEGTHGKAMAVVHRACAPCPEGGGGAHRHSLDFQMNYLLRGWMRVVFEQHGEFTFESGDSWLQPPNIEHNVTGFSDDLEVLEITMPAKFDTTES